MPREWVSFKDTNISTVVSTAFTAVVTYHTFGVLFSLLPPAHVKNPLNFTLNSAGGEPLAPPSIKRRNSAEWRW